jgi:Dolichyl-phosphate-mannose-protein mannosyltransferase
MLKIRPESFGPQLKGRLALVTVFAVALLLRLYRLGAHDLWYDEVFSVLYAEFRSGGGPTLFWKILSFWIKIFGISEFSLRFLPMLFSFFTTIAVFLLGKELFNRKTALFSTWLIAVSPFHLWYAQEARHYSMSVFLGTLSSYILFLTLRQNSLKKWAAFVLLSLAGVCTNYFHLFLLAAQFLYGLYISQFRRRKVFLLFLPVAAVLSLFPPQDFLRLLSMYSRRGFWIPPPDWQRMYIVLQNYMLGYNGTALLYALSSCVAFASLIHLFFIAQKKKDMHRSISFCVFLFMIPIVSIFLFSKLFFSIFLTRGMLLFSPYFYLLIAYGVMEWRKEVRAVVVAILIGILSCGVYLYFKDHLYPPFEYHIGVFLKKPVRPVVDYLNERAGEKDLVAATSKQIMPGITFYSKEKFQPYLLKSPLVREVSGMPGFRLTQNQELTVDEISKHDFKRLWLISANWGRDAKFDPNAVLVRKWLNDHLRPISRREMDGLKIFGYEKRQPDQVDDHFSSL